MIAMRHTQRDIEHFITRHRQGVRVGLVPTHVEISCRMPAVRGDAPWTKKLTGSQRHFFLWLVQSITAVGGRLVIDFAELEHEVGIGKQTLAAAAQVLHDRDLVTVEAEPGATRFGLHTFRLSPSSAAELLAASDGHEAKPGTAGKRKTKPAGCESSRPSERGSSR